MSSEPAGDILSPSWAMDDQGIGWITFDDPERGLNILTEEVLHGLAHRVLQASEAASEGLIRAVVVRSGKADSFIAGADVDAIARIESPSEGSEAARFGQEIFLSLEKLDIPTVAAIHGICLGGGVEMALACEYRVGSDSDKTKLGCPEVQLGILPAWGGTTRLPRLVGLQGSLDLLLTGKTIDASRARRLGILDVVFPAELFQENVERFVLDRLEGIRLERRKKRGLGKRLLDHTAPGRRVVLAAARKKVKAETRGHYPAPLRILDVVGKSLGRPLEKALEIEALAAGELIASRVSKNLIHVFHLRERARKGRGVASDVEPLPVRRIGVVGAGVMGGGIAQLAAYNGLQARLKDIRHEAISSALNHARGLYEGLVKRRKLSRREAGQHMERISGGLGYDGFGTLDLVVEAVVERMDVKRSVLAEIEERVPDSCVLTTNTSTLSIDEMAEALKRPERFCGMHFFNPVHKMPLVEVIRGNATSDEALATVFQLALRLGKVPVVVRNGPGFLVNRILGPYLNEAGHLLAAGASIEAIDDAALDFGLPMGPLRLIDEVGIDVMRHASGTLHAAFGDRMIPAPALVALGETDRLGRKGGRGFYVYEEGKEKGRDESVYPEIGLAPPGGRGPVDRQAIRRRLVLAMVNEAARALEDGIAAGAADVDVAMIMGTGFPPFRGGLLRYADDAHPRTVLDRLKELTDTVGPRFEPAALIRSLAEEDGRFYDAFPG